MKVVLFEARRLTVLALAAFAAAAPAGCGWTPRDEFMLSRGITIRSRPGDNSIATSNWQASRGQDEARSEVAARWDASRP